MIEMSMSQQDDVRSLDIGGRETKRLEHTAPIEMGVEQDNLAVVNQLVIGVASPPDRQRPRVLRKCSAGRHQSRPFTARIASGDYPLSHDSRVRKRSGAGR